MHATHAVQVKLLAWTYPSDLEKQINELLDDGWALYGIPYLKPPTMGDPEKHCQMMMLPNED